MFNKIYEKLRSFIKNYYIDLIIVALAFFLAFFKLPYLVYRPGGSIDLAERVSTLNGDEVNGGYYMNYVSVANGNIPNLLVSLFNKEWEVVKEEELTMGYDDYDTAFKVEQLDYQNSIFLATYNACNLVDNCKLTINSQKVYVVYIDDNAKTDLKIMDEIISVDGKSYDFSEDILNYISTKKIGDSITFEVLENDNKKTRTAEIVDINGEPKVGIIIYNSNDYTVDPNVSIKTKSSEAGSSGGLMLTLAVYDSLSPDDIARGRKVMGTGTIDAYGNVGEIGGVKYKMLGAKKDKADVFFSPMENCDEAKQVKNNYNIKYDVVCVATLNDAIDYLNNK